MRIDCVCEYSLLHGWLKKKTNGIKIIVSILLVQMDFWQNGCLFAILLILLNWTELINTINRRNARQKRYICTVCTYVCYSRQLAINEEAILKNSLAKGQHNTVATTMLDWPVLAMTGKKKTNKCKNHKNFAISIILAFQFISTRWQRQFLAVTYVKSASIALIRYEIIIISIF